MEIIIADIHKVLLLKMRYIGDTILTLPLVQTLKEGVPSARIDVGVNRGSDQVLYDHPMIEKCWVFTRDSGQGRIRSTINFIRAIRREKYDLVIDLTHNDRTALFTFLSGSPLRIGYRSDRHFREKATYTHAVPSELGNIHTVDHHLKIAEFLGLPIKERNPSIPVSPERLKKIEETLAGQGIASNQDFVLIHPGARRPYKSWPLHRFARLADDIFRKFGFKVILSGGREDLANTASIEAQMDTEPLNLAGKIPLRDLAALIKKGICLIGNDSAPIHIASAVETPTLSLFGPTRWENWAPRRKSDRVLAAEYPCRPCGHSSSECPLGDRYCLNSISYKSVLTAVEDALHSQQIKNN